MRPGPPERSARTHLLRSWKWRIVLGYLALLVSSHFVRWVRAEEPAGDNDPSVIVQAVDGEHQINKEVRLAYREHPPSATEAQPVVILIHGSPGHKEDFRSLAPELANTIESSHLTFPDSEARLKAFPSTRFEPTPATSSS